MTNVTMQEKTSAPASVEATKDIVVANIVKTASAKEKPTSAGVTTSPPITKNMFMLPTSSTYFFSLASSQST